MASTDESEPGTPIRALGAIGKVYLNGQERLSVMLTDTEEIYRRDAATGLYYADRHYEQPGVGRFMSPDPYKASAGASDPGSGNWYLW